MFVCLIKLVSFEIAFAPDGSEKHFKRKRIHFLDFKSDQRKLFKILRNNRFSKKSCNVQQDLGPSIITRKPWCEYKKNNPKIVRNFRVITYDIGIL